MSAAAPHERAIRVFISSTFQDMKEDRDQLVNHVFPHLRKLCEERAVVWSEIDLRWGLTDEEVAEGKVLPICLEEIKRCLPERRPGSAKRSPLPYFIGLLGERYGWIPLEFPKSLCKQEPWLLAQEGASVTELEILHGVLRNPKMAGHALFYLRDPAYGDSDAVPESQRQRFREEPTSAEIDEHGKEEAERRARERRRKLSELKERIRASDFLARDYDDPNDLGDKVKSDLEAVIEGLFPEDETVDPIDAETQRHEFFARARSKVYVERSSYFEKLDEFARGGDEDNVLAVIGESGRGKSALLSTWALRYRSEHPDDLVLIHFIGSSQKSAELIPLLTRLNHDLEKYLELEHSEQVEHAAGETTNLRQVFAERLIQAGDRGNVVLLLDALNQLDDRDGAQSLSWVPETIPKGVRLIVSTLGSNAKEELSRRGWLEGAVEIGTLTPEERRQLIDRYLARHVKQLSDIRKEELADLPQGGNALHLRTLLDELRVWGAHEDLDTRIEELASAPSIDALFELILERYEDDYAQTRPNLVSDAMTLIWASRQGLEESELLDMLGKEGERLPAAFWSPLRIAAGDMLIDRAGLIDFAHDFFRHAVKDRYLDSPSARERAHRKISSYIKDRGPASRALEEVPWQLNEIEAWDELVDLLTDEQWFLPLWQASPHEVKRLWARIRESSGHEPGECYRAALDGSPTDRPAFALAAADLLHDLGAYEASQELLTALSELARETANPLLLRDTLRILLSILRHRGHPDEALELAREHEAICRELGDLDGMARAIANQGLIHGDWNNNERALELHREDERISKSTGNRAGMERAFNNQGLVVQAQGDLREAMSLYRAAEAISRELGDPTGIKASLGNQATVQRLLKNHEAALELFDEEEPIARELGDQQGLEMNLGGRVDVHMDLGEYDRAMELCIERERICKELESPRGLQSTLGDMAVIESSRGNHERAVELYDEEERICRKSNDRTGLRWTLGQLATRWLERGDLDKALKLYREQEELCAQMSDDGVLQWCVGQQALVHKAGGDDEKAMSLLSRYESLCLAKDDLDTLRWPRRQRAEILADRKDWAGAFSCYEDLIERCTKRDDLAGLAWALGMGAEVLEKAGEPEGSLKLQLGREEVCRKLDDPDALLIALYEQGLLCYFELTGSPELKARAIDLFEEAVSIARNLGNRGVMLAGNLGMLGAIRTFEGEAARGEAMLEEATVLARAEDNPQLLDGIQELAKVARNYEPPAA